MGTGRCRGWFGEQVVLFVQSSQDPQMPARHRRRYLGELAISRA